MKPMIIMSLLFLSGCGFLHKQEIKQATEIAKLTPTQQTTVYIDRVMKQTDWFVTICLIGGVLGFIAFLSGNGIGLKIIAGCAFGICASLAMASAAAYIVVITKWALILAAVSALVAFGLLLYAIFVKGRALKEIVAGVQAIKNNTPISVALHGQSPSTKAIVSSIKESLPATEPKL
jgi:hypothetical protein